jgi:hypothetical protein
MQRRLALLDRRDFLSRIGFSAAALGVSTSRADFSAPDAHIFGWFLSGLHTEEFYHWACSTERLAGYSQRTNAAFRAWLREKYGTDTALQDAWKAADVTLRTATIPSRDQRRDVGDGVFRNPARQQNVLDFYAFWNELIPETIDHFAAVARRVTGGRQVIGLWEHRPSIVQPRR